MVRRYPYERLGDQVFSDGMIGCRFQRVDLNARFGISNELRQFFAQHGRCARCNGTLEDWSIHEACKAGARRFFQSSDLEVLLPLDTFHAHWKVRVRETRRRTSFHRALKSKAAPGSRTAEQIRTLLALQERRCYYCYRSLEGPGGAVNGPGEPTSCHEDHYVSLHHGGSHFISNIVLACVSCNSRKSDLHGDDFVREALGQATLARRRQLLRIHRNRAAHAFRLVVEVVVDAGDD
ncbi:HNH endonuclease signature motif containing protein [Stenotrophomonas maltophilia]|uniref:HNH endonuclease n=1 Tax=Stenotrophomonas maltophilia TaxID=40324 RepID=UPI0004681CEB|nr:HNH endonuclease signature motif containing protein [Stenotrophomonas maltophilia]OMP41481.1 hypothetical protein BMR86_01530 [Stenotrophomonas sp. KAs 5-3]AIL09501.1 HNH endonuclease family protein [Stenotrophomonas maltophilia]OOD12324.1 HNH endonuclease [Stenotrophomonas maltophilia]QQA83956.1 HNH endonuclease [Stenotrophomonas maltophilia]WQE25165.1 HNH endonuclease signature motif containing protein [Stenotrophomonas maltophilia]